MEDGIPDTLLIIRIFGYAIRVDECTIDFEALINDVLHAYLDNFCTAFLDDIFIYSNTMKEHKEQVYKVLKALSQAGLHLKLEKCHFHKQEVKYLGFIIATKGIRMDPEKVSCVLGWETPKNVTDVQCFLGSANFYKQFIKYYSKVVTHVDQNDEKGGRQLCSICVGTAAAGSIRSHQNSVHVGPYPPTLRLRPRNNSRNQRLGLHLGRHPLPIRR